MASQSSQNTTTNSHHTISATNPEIQNKNTLRQLPIHTSNPLLFSSMPGLMAAAVAGFKTLIPLNAQILTNNANLNNSGSSTIASSSPSSGTSTPGSNNSNNNPISLTNPAIMITGNINNGLNSGTSMLDLIMCKLTSPFHVVNDPRLLECGSSGCYECILSSMNSQNNLSCPYCNNVHNIAADVNKLIVNKNLQAFVKSNLFRQDPSAKVLSQSGMSMESFDQYLTFVQNDVQMKIETMKTHLEKYGEQFIDNLKLIRKEVQKQWVDHNSSMQTNKTSSTDISSAPIQLQSTVNHNFQQQLLLQHHQQQQQQQQQHQSSTRNNSSVLALLSSSNNNNNNNSSNNTNISLINDTADNSKFQINSFPNHAIFQHASNQIPGNHSINIRVSPMTNQQLQQRTTSTSNEKQSTEINSLNGSVDALHNSFNFNNSACWNGNEDDLDDLDTELSIKSANQSSTSSSQAPGRGVLAKRQLNKEQAQFNKFVREEVSKKFGEDFLLQHEVNQLESSVMDMIKNEAISSFLPKDTTPARAWTLAKVSLRSLKRDLRRKNERL